MHVGAAADVLVDGAIRKATVVANTAGATWDREDHSYDDGASEMPPPRRAYSGPGFGVLRVW